MRWFISTRNSSQSTFLPSTFRKGWTTPTRHSSLKSRQYLFFSRPLHFIYSSRGLSRVSRSSRSRVLVKMHFSSSALPLALLHLLFFFGSSAAQSTYWLANKPNVGKVAFQDPSYPVFRNVKDFGAVGGSFIGASLAWSLISFFRRRQPGRYRCHQSSNCSSWKPRHHYRLS
jgi:hypothetical protein